MSPLQVVTGPPSVGSVLRPQLVSADFVHACQATTHRDGRSALQAYRDMAATIPGWFDGLMALRNHGMRLLGMKDLGSLRAVQGVADPQPGQRLGIFTLQSLDDDAILSLGADVMAAGEVRFVNGAVRSIDNASGHYRPTGASARQAAEAAFGRSGFDAVGKYSEKVF